MSSASRNIFIDNSLASINNLFSKDIVLQVEGRVALTDLMFPTQFKKCNIYKNDVLKKIKLNPAFKWHNVKKTWPFDIQTRPLKISTKTIARLILIISVKASTPLSNLFQYGCIIGMALNLRVHMFLVLGTTGIRVRIYELIGIRVICYEGSIQIHSTLTS